MGGVICIEFCLFFVLGGLIFSVGLMYSVGRVLLILVYVMIRLREGDFFYYDDEFSIMV